MARAVIDYVLLFDQGPTNNSRSSRPEEHIPFDGLGEYLPNDNDGT